MNMTNDKQYKLLSTMRGSALLGMIAVFIVLANVSDAGIDGGGIVKGRITGFGSIFVNNREFTIDAGTAISAEGQPGNEADLRLGQIVFVRGLLDNEDPVGLADIIVFSDNVEGPISEINGDDGELAVLGQRILTDDLTVIDTLSGENSLENLKETDQVEISGFLTDSGEIVASRIEQKTGGALEVTGIVSDLQAGTFAINALTVDFSSAVLLDSSASPIDSIIEGDAVEAQGVMLGVNGELVAQRVQVRQAIAGTEGERGEFEGLVTRIESASRFDVGETPVLTDGNTVFKGGGPGNLAANTSVEVLGQFDSDGVLAADQVTIRGTRIRIHALVDSVSANSLIALGIQATVDSSTNMRDKSSARREPFKLSDLNPADFIEVRSFKNPGASTPLTAQMAIREDSQSDIRLQGFVDLISTEYFSVHGVTIDVDQDTSYSDANGDEISKSDFFGLLTTTSFVKIGGNEIAGTVVLAEKVSLQLDD